jgi:hypothetical protein
MASVTPVLFMFCAIALIWMLAALIPRRKLPQERGLTPIYQTICAGIQTSRFNVLRMGTAIPFWRISLYEHFAVIAIWIPRAIEYSDFDSIRCKNLLLFKSVRFRSVKYELNFSAWVLSSQPLITVLLEQKVPVSGYGVDKP